VSISGQVVNLVFGRFGGVVFYSRLRRCRRAPATGGRFILAAMFLDYA